ncbi:MAG TPA: kelch repeat-containing protein [Candidatus Eisenbacteria bacterium]|nr:kelch repeat-containing protein [Candidatus Eisenbacteria bacterium]
MEQTGRWAVSGPWGHQPIHTAIMRGDATHHTKILSWYQSWNAKLYGWNPAFTQDGGSCSIFPDEQFQMLPIDTNVVGIYDIVSVGHSTLANGDLLVTGGLGPGRAADWRTLVFRRNATPPDAQWVVRSNMKTERYYHASTTLADGNVLVHGGARYYHMAVVGGTADPANPTSAVRDEIQRMGMTSTGRWLDAQIPAFRPEAREGHSAVTLGMRGLLDTTVVFGGRKVGGQVLNDTWGLRIDPSVDAMGWDPIDASAPPPARSRHSAVLLGDRRMVIYGGLGVNDAARSDVRDLRPPVGALPWRWSTGDLNPGGPDDPGARYGHAAIYDGANGRNRMLVFGGRSNSGLSDNDLYALDMTTLVWSRPALATTDKPGAREGHSWTVDPYPRSGPFSGSDRRAVLFGGQTSAGLNNETWVLWMGPSGQVRWEQRTATTAPLPRTRHAAAWDESFDPGDITDRLVVMGGDVGGTASAETWALNHVLGAWTALNDAPLAQAGHSITFRTSPLYALNADRYDIATGQWTAENDPKQVGTHPNFLLLPSGNLFFAGPAGATYRYKTSGAPPRWSPLGTSPVQGQPAVLLYRPNPDQAVEVMKCGGLTGANSQTAKIAIKPDDTSSLGWQVQNLATPDTMMARIEHNLVVLPTGKVLMTGGRRGFHNDHDDADTLTNPGVHQPQLWDPDLGPAGAWKGRGVLAEDPARRGFHSTALLLPDARILSLGSNPPSAFRFLATVYCPPYLFNPGGSLAQRPTITAWHDSAGYNLPMPIWTESPDSIVSVCMIRPGAVTHSHNQDQRYLQLEFQVVTRAPEQGCPQKEIVATTPLNANYAPPGDYLLFVIKRSPFDRVAPADTVVPSVGQWVRMRSGPHGPLVGAPPSTCPPVAVESPSPSRFTLHQNQPNPSKQSTTIRFELPVQCRVKLVIFDVAGRRVRTLVDKAYGPGRHGIEWDQRDERGIRVRTGVFTYRLVAGAFRGHRTMVVLR